MLFRPIHHTFAPLADWQQCLLALSFILTPWRLQRGKAIEQLRSELSTAFNGDAVLFASGREALLCLFKALKLRPGEEVIVQAYTCVAVPNAIHAAGAVPVYADIDRETLNLNLVTVMEAITPRTRALLCQHTFGIPSPVKELRALCDAKGIILIEDCAHVLPDATGPMEIGKYGDFLMLSFGRDKAISGVAGGALISRKSELHPALREAEERASSPSLYATLRWMLYPLAYAKARPFIGLGIGKAYLKVLRALHLLPAILDAEEKRGHMSPVLARIPNACAALALAQWRRRKSINDHRRSLTAFYADAARKRGWETVPAAQGNLPLQKFPIFVRGAAQIRASLKRQNIHLDDGWTSCVICPASVDPSVAGYQTGADPSAEQVSREILSLPTHPGMTMAQAQRLVATIDVCMRELRSKN
ncbi:MAG: aminotransferase class I/II-fold pyridoxal phosphate-dependent enzyme [Candidatus Peregrinibacteria bacterium]|nr:aminotransferase class I/II-fold pyridoxal phosphate-dependent enzyme [Candidatus Peregrinibacteria bacterium]